MRHLALLLTGMFSIFAWGLDVRNLRVEDYRNPIGIDVVCPHLSWELSSEVRGTVQQSYNIQIATDAMMGNVIWDSGSIASEKNVDVPLDGFSARPRTRYFWRVTVTDNHGETATSLEKAYFEAGLMNEQEWSEASWIKATKTPIGYVPEGETVSNYEITLTFEVKNQAAGIIFGSTDHNNFYMWQFSNATGTARFRPHKWTNGSASCLLEKTLSGTSLTQGKTHKLRIVVTGGNKAMTYLNGTLIDTRTGDFPYGGDYGFRQFGGSNPEQAYFDDLLVKSGSQILLQENFNGSTCIFDGGELVNGRFYASGPSKYFWQKKQAKQVRFDLDVDMTLINHNASVCFGATTQTTYMMWQICTKGVSKPALRRHAYNNDALTYSDTPLTLTAAQILNHQHHLHIECDAPYVRTFIDDELVDTYEDAAGILDYGDVGFRVSAASDSDERAYFDNLVVKEYDSEGNATIRLSEDFEGESNPFFGAEVLSYQGSRQLYMKANKGFRKRTMQADGSIIPGNPILRKSFNTEEKEIHHARLYATALGIYNVYINGKRVGITDDDGNTIQDELKPGSTDYNKTLFYTTHDVTNLLEEGKNAIGVELSSGWWNGAIAHGVFGNKDCAFRGLLVITYADGTEQHIPSDLSWLSQWNGPLRRGDIYHGEEYDARFSSNWSTAAFDDSDWYQTAASTDFKGTLQSFKGGPVITVPELARHPKTIQIYNVVDTGSGFGRLDETESYASQHTINLKAGQVAIYDMGQNGSGWVSFKAKGNRGTHLRFRFAEMRNETGDASRGEDGPAGSVYLTNLRSAEATLYYTLAGTEEGESYHPTTTYFGFRYVEVTTSDDIELSDVVGETLTTSMDESSNFACSHTDINQLYSNIMWGERSNFISVPTDCPQRDERLGWGADTQVFSMAGLYNADSRNFYKKWVQDMRDSQRDDGAYPLVAPYIWGDRGYGQAGWAEAGLIVPYNVYLMTGDKEVLRDHYASMKKHMEWCATKAGDGYLYNGADTKYCDWLAYLPTDKRYVSVCYYAYAAQLMRDIAQALSENENDLYARDAKNYQQLFENIRSEWQERYLNAQKTPIHDTQCAYLMALRYNLLPDETSVDATVRKLQAAIRGNNYTLNTGFLGTAILNQTLSDCDLNMEAYTILLQRNDPSWLYSIDQGATTMWERWNSYTKANGMGPANMNSFNHYAYGAVADWMYRYMAGISPDTSEPGFHHFILKPHPDDRNTLLYQQQRITWTDATFHSDYGPIHARWQWEEQGRIIYEVTVPANTTATLYMPCPEGYEVHESGEEIERAEGVALLRYEGGNAILELGSGSYIFSTAIADRIIKPESTEKESPYYRVDGIKLPEKSGHKGLLIYKGKKLLVK